jgi:hypothetical protein
MVRKEAHHQGQRRPGLQIYRELHHSYVIPRPYHQLNSADCSEERIQNFAPTPEQPFVLGLPTGSSPEIVYKYLVQAFKAGEISFNNVVTFNMVSLGSFWVL